MRAATATASASAWTSAWYLFQPWSYSCDQASAWASSAVCIRCALRLPTTDCWLYAVSWVTTGRDGAEAGGCMRGRTTVARTTVHTRTARKSATKPTCSSFRSPYPWGAFRPELGAETCGGTAQVNCGKGESLPDARRLCVAVSEVVRSAEQRVQQAPGGRRDVVAKAVEAPQAALLAGHQAGCPEHPHVMGDGGLAKVVDGDQVADANRLAMPPQGGHHAQTGRIRQRLEHVHEP